MIKTVLGNVPKSQLGVTLAHEHICCYSEYACQMAGEQYLNKDELAKTACTYLKMMKQRYGLTTLVDCTPVNIGRDVDLLKRVSEEGEIHIVCATGFYYTDEPVLHASPTNRLRDYLVADAKTTNAGIIKYAVEHETVGAFQEKLLRACARAHLDTALPIVIHTNATNQNARRALEILLSEKVSPNAITVGHLSDADDTAYIKEIAACGCWIGFDRLYDDPSAQYVSKKLCQIKELFASGYGDRVLLSHDAQFFNGFEAEPQICKTPRLSYCFEYILPQLPQEWVEMLTVQNPMRMLSFT